MTVTSLALPIIGTSAIVGGVWAFVLLVARIERARPPLSSEWSERDFGDQPEIESLFHFGTHTTRRRNDHVSR